MLVKKKRRQRRIPLLAIAEVMTSNNGASHSAITQNMTIAGAGLYMYHAIAKGSPVSITISFSARNGKRPFDTIEGIVTSVTEVESLYCVGVRFNSPLNPEDQPNLYPLVLSDVEQV